MAEAPAILPPPERTSHPFHMHTMIGQIPDAIRATLRRNEARFAEIAHRSRDRTSVVFTGCGTAFFAAMLAERAIASYDDGSVASSALQAFELMWYRPRRSPSTLAIGISHSGITRATVDALRVSRERGASTVGITHFEARPIGSVADATILAGNGPDESRCHTKCYVAGAIAGSELGLAFLRARGTNPSGLEDCEEGIRSLPDLVEKVARSSERDAERLAGTYRKAQDFYFVGGGPNEPTAFEAALKMKESSFVRAEGMELEQMLHGPWISLDHGTVLFVIAPMGPSRDRASDLLLAARKLGVQTVAVTSEGDEKLTSAADFAFEIPAVDEYLSAYLAIIPLYYFAYYASVLRGQNPDYLRYLTPAYWSARHAIFPPGTH
ncbi:MAG TPA: SIS domain-containing protein [Thermoplasmata archaeon]|jgi:glucosamine--fructose-6-phosphate aminotransferase (isomerizing)